MKLEFSIVIFSVCRVRRITSTNLYLAGVRGNGQSGIAYTGYIGVIGGIVINSAFKLS